MGVSAKLNLEMNSVSVPRKPGEAVGAICKLTKGEKELIINVEYNQISSVLTEEPKNEQGYSLLPGNINGLIFSLNEYNNTLEKT